MEQQIQELRVRADEAVRGATTLRELDDVRVKFLGKKGELTTLLRGMSKLTAEASSSTRRAHKSNSLSRKKIYSSSRRNFKLDLRRRQST